MEQVVSLLLFGQMMVGAWPACQPIGRLYIGHKSKLCAIAKSSWSCSPLLHMSTFIRHRRFVLCRLFHSAIFSLITIKCGQTDWLKNRYRVSIVLFWALRLLGFLEIRPPLVVLLSSRVGCTDRIQSPQQSLKVSFVLINFTKNSTSDLIFEQL